ncbi:MAG: NUDIX domain-containing protein [Candidatus Peribacteraceae bacterium]|nr:NUDIX domain-containing protein [Candidatus Peribacteraceae bacterium]
MTQKVNRMVAALLVASSDEQGPFVVLQRRGEWDYEKGQSESWPGACQSTANGGMEDEDEEDTLRAMRREVFQELGPEFAGLLMGPYAPSRLCRIVTDRLHREVEIYWVQVPEAMLGSIVLHASTGGLVRIRPGQEILDMSVHFTREDGVPDRRIIAGYPETIQAVERAFKLLSSAAA